MLKVLVQFDAYNIYMSIVHNITLSFLPTFFLFPSPSPPPPTHTAEYGGVRWEDVSDDGDDDVSGDDEGGEEVDDMETDTTAVQHKVLAPRTLVICTIDH